MVECRIQNEMVELMRFSVKNETEPLQIFWATKLVAIVIYSFQQGDGKSVSRSIAIN